MKNLNTVFNILLTIAVVVLFYLHFSGKQNSANAPVENIPAISTEMKADLPKGSIVYINTDSLMANYKYVIDVKKKLEKERNEKEAQFQSKYQALEQQVNSFKEVAARLSQAEGERQQAELMQKEQKLGEYREQAMAELMTKEQDQNILIQKKITDYIALLNKESNYTFVLGYAQGGGILYANKTLDITKIVLDGLNAAYKSK